MKKKTKELSNKHSYKNLPFILFGLLIIGLFFFITNSILDRSVLGASSNASTIITVNTSQSGISLPSRFLGFSFETEALCNLTSLWNTPVFQRLVKNLGSQVIRIGGNSADHALWSTTGNYSCSGAKTVLTPKLIDSFFNLAVILNTKVMWTLNLGNYAPSTYSNEASYVMEKGEKLGQNTGDFLWALGMGNEPDLYPTNGVKTTSYSLSDFIHDWNAYKETIRKTTNKPHEKFFGPDIDVNDTWFTTLISSEPNVLSLVSHHFYPIHKNRLPTPLPSAQTVATMLLASSLMQQTGSTFDTWKHDAGSVPLVVNETNSINEGGMRGVSDTFASTLWGIDYIFTALQHGVSQLNFHTGGMSAYTPIAFIENGQASPRPLYYAMLLFHYAFPAGKLVATQVSSPYNITAYSVFDNNTLRVVLINKDETNNATVQLRLDKAFAKANSIYLTAPSVTATTGITFGGSSITNDGTWTPKVGSVLLCKTTSTINLPAASAAVIVFSNPGEETQSGCSRSAYSSTPTIQQAGVDNIQKPTSHDNNGNLPNTNPFIFGTSVITTSVNNFILHLFSR